MSDWINVNRASLHRQSTTHRIGSVTVQASVSPDDLPVRVSGHYLPDKRTFFIKFQYISGEELLEHVRIDSHISAFIGKRSRRLHEVHFENLSEGEQVAERVKSWFSKAVENLKTRVQRPRELNYAAANDVAQNVAGVFHELAM